MLLNELGFDEGLVTPLRERYLHPITSLLYPDCGGCCLDSHKAFVVKYDMREDLDLSYHYDNAEVTLNISLGKDFTGGNLYFGDMNHVRIIAACNIYCVDVCLKMIMAVLCVIITRPIDHIYLITAMTIYWDTSKLGFEPRTFWQRP